MANYVLNKIICTKEILRKYFVDNHPIDDKDLLKEPYISFNIMKDMENPFIMVLVFHMKRTRKD